MRRRSFLYAGALSGAGVISGCSRALGPSEQTTTAIDAASSDLIDARTRLDRQLDQFGPVDTVVEFDALAVLESIESAVDELDTADEHARQEETTVQIAALRSVAEYLDTLTRAGDRLGRAHAEATTGIDSFDEGAYDRADQAFEEGVTVVRDTETELTEAQATFDAIDSTVLEDLAVARERLQDTATRTGSIRSGYEFLLAGLARIGDGFAHFAAGVTDFEGSDYGRSTQSFDRSRDAFDTVSNVVAGYADVPMPDGLRSAVDESLTIAAAMVELAASHTHVASVFTAIDEAFDLANSYRFDSAIRAVESAESHLDPARTALDAANEAVDDLAGTRNDLFEMAEADIRTRLDNLDLLVSTVGPLVSGNRSYVEGLERYDAARIAKRDEAFERAAEAYADAADRFDDAQAGWQAAGDLAPEHLQAPISNLACYVGELHDAARLRSEANEARAAGDEETAETKEAEVRAAFEQCGSAASNDLVSIGHLRFSESLA